MMLLRLDPRILADMWRVFFFFLFTTGTIVLFDDANDWASL